VSGYSGRDVSIMAAFTEAFTRPRHRRPVLVWHGWCRSAECSSRPHRGCPKSRGAQPITFQTLGFDDLVTRLARHCLDGALASALRRSWLPSRRKPFLLAAPLRFPIFRPARSSEQRLRDPVSAGGLHLRPREWPEEHVWKHLDGARARMKSWPSR